jgi:hypothetical protein
MSDNAWFVTIMSIFIKSSVAKGCNFPLYALKFTGVSNHNGQFRTYILPSQMPHLFSVSYTSYLHYDMFRPHTANIRYM